jgi:hypothetical protein
MVTLRILRTGEFGADISLVGKGRWSRSGKMPGDVGQRSRAFLRPLRYGLMFRATPHSAKE